MQSLYNDQCVEYNGVCVRYLQKLDNGTSLFTSMHNKVSEDDITNFINILFSSHKIIEEQCRKAVLPFLCQYAFPPCNVSSGNKNFISQTQCTKIRDDVCSFEWNVVINMPAVSSLLPNCENFDDDNDDDEDNDTVLITPKPLQCHYHFKEFCGLCLPLCGKFSQHRVKTKFLEKGVLIFSSITGFIGGIIVFIASGYRWKAM